MYSQTGHNDNTLQRMRIAWITKATNTHSQYITLSAFPLQQWLQWKSSKCYVYTYTDCLVINKRCP